MPRELKKLGPALLLPKVPRGLPFSFLFFNAADFNVLFQSTAQGANSHLGRATGECLYTGKALGIAKAPPSLTEPCRSLAGSPASPEQPGLARHSPSHCRGRGLGGSFQALGRRHACGRLQQQPRRLAPPRAAELGRAAPPLPVQSPSRGLPNFIRSWPPAKSSLLPAALLLLHGGLS